MASVQIFGFEPKAYRTQIIIWLRFIYPHRISTATAAGALSCKRRCPVLSMVVWTLKREVRASGECLGMYRR